LEECYEAAAKSIELDPANAERAADALAHMADAMWQKGDMEKCLDASMRLLEPKHLSHRNEREHPNYQKRPGECLLRLQRYAEAAAHFLRIEKRTENQLFAQECCLQAGRAFLSAQHYADARKTLERVLLDYPEHTDYWHHAQQGIVEALGSEGRFKQALQAARILLDASRDRNYIAQNTRLIAELFQAIDKHVGRANQMINFQRFGPDGEDGKAGTADDLNDPLIAMGRPAYPERERAFAGARRKAGDTAAASRYRALTYIYAGQPKEALKHYIDAFARARGNDFRTMGNDLIVIGARAVRGHAVGLKAFADFVNYGPAGPDGKPGTPDDLTDPFALLLR
jgi:tetratricopeptide (TPR) repeat protein